MNPLHELMSQHRSVRKFAPEELTDEVVHTAVAAAQMASTSSHVQAYSVLRVRDSQTRETLVALTGGQPQVAEAGGFFVVCGDVRRHRLLAARDGGDAVQNLETFLVAVIDGSLFAQNLVLAFESEGFGICYIGGLRNDLARVRDLLELPDGVWPLYGLCVGVPLERPEVKPRLPVDGVLFEDRYPDDSRLMSFVDAFDGTMADYYGERGLANRNWSGGIVRKFEKARREDLASFYRAQGACFE